eukprot:94367-Chlamydomonas_euryale.AAC.1
MYKLKRNVYAMIEAMPANRCYTEATPERLMNHERLLFVSVCGGATTGCKETWATVQHAERGAAFGNVDF